MSVRWACEIVLPYNNGTYHWAMIRWCTDQFGTRWNAVPRNKTERNGVWTVFWCGLDNPTCYRWLFKNESDATIFSLRWA